MAFTTTTNKALYVGNGVTTAFTAPFLFYDNTQLVVSLINTTTSVETPQTITTHYTVSGAGVSTGGTVTFVTAPASGFNVLIKRVVPATQLVDLKEGDKFPPETVEQALDLGAMVDQQLAEVDSRCIKLPSGTTLSSIEIPDIALAANQSKVLRSKADGTGFEFVSGLSTALVSPVSPVDGGTGATSALGALSGLAIVGRVTSVSALKNLDATKLSNNDVVLTEGYYSGNDAGGGLYRWDSASVVADNGGTFLQPTAGGTGRWRLLHNGTVTVLQFGAKGDGATNDQPAIQAAITWGAANGQHVHLPGFLTSGTEARFLCTSQVAVPANRTFKLTMHGGHWHFTSALGANSGLLFDSCMMTEVDLQGEIVYAGTGNAVEFNPTTNVPVDAVKTVIDSRFKINTVVNTNVTLSNANVRLNPGTGAISGNIFQFSELNGEGAAGGGGITSFGIVLDTPGVSLGCSGNLITCPHIHNHNSASVQVGVSTTRATQIFNNHFIVNCYPNNTKDGFNCYGINNSGQVLVLPSTGTPGNGIVFQSTATNNQLDCTAIGATTSILENATVKSNLVRHKLTRANTSITVGASPFTYSNASARMESVVIVGGTISAIDYAGDQGNTFSALGTGQRFFYLAPGDAVKVTYTAAPTMTKAFG